MNKIIAVYNIIKIISKKKLKKKKKPQKNKKTNLKIIKNKIYKKNNKK